MTTRRKVLPTTHDPAAEGAPVSRDLIGARLIVLMKLLHRSANRVYRTEGGLSDFEWRVLTQVGSHEPVGLTELATLLNQDKGQVSHAMKGLAEARLVSREHLRAPIVLSDGGRDAYAQVLRIARSRNRALLRSLAPAERKLLPTLLATLQANARLLLNREYGAPAPTHARVRSVLLAQQLFALYSMLQRSAASAYRRETGLSDFEWRVVAKVAEHAPITLIDFMPIIDRNKSQVGRALARLAARGLVTRETMGTRRHIRVDITPSGRESYKRICAVALQRQDTLATGLSAEEQRALMTIFDKLTGAAGALLTRLDKS